MIVSEDAFTEAFYQQGYEDNVDEESEEEDGASDSTVLLVGSMENDELLALEFTRKLGFVAVLEAI